MKKIIVSQAETGPGGQGYKAIAEGVPGEDYSGKTIPQAVGGLIRIIYEDLGISEDQLQTGVGLGRLWDDMTNIELYYYVVRDLGIVSVEGP